MNTVTSKDGTTIAFERLGTGPAVVLSSGMLCDRGTTRSLARWLAPELTVYCYDRRGRGDSGDAETYAVEREIEDLAAVVAAAGGSAMVYGQSSGAILGLEAAAHGVPITRIAVYQPSWVTTPDARSPRLAAQVAMLLVQDRREDAVRCFLAGSGTSDQALDQLAGSPRLRQMAALAHTMPNDFALAGSDGIPKWVSRIAVPTLVLDGGASDAAARTTCVALAALVPGARYRTIAGQDHSIDHEAVAPVLLDFFGRDRPRGLGG